jgi:hypothetical protein
MSWAKDPEALRCNRGANAKRKADRDSLAANAVAIEGSVLGISVESRDCQLPVDTKKQGEPPRSRGKHAGRHVRIPGRKNPATQEMAGQVASSRLLFPEEEIRERLRVQGSHAGHVIPALIRVQAEIGAE